MTTKTYATSIDIPEAKRAPLITLLNLHVANLLALYGQAKHAHWNVKGSDFIQLHELFDDLATSVLEHLDETAERAVQLGGVAFGTVQSASEHASLPHYPLEAVDGREHIEAVAKSYGVYANLARAAITEATSFDDMNTADLFTEISRAIDKHLWFLEAHLQAKSFTSKGDFYGSRDM
jgi:starvation-inducible DNA-binding protein